MNRTESLQLRQQRGKLASDMLALMNADGTFKDSATGQATWDRMSTEERDLKSRIDRIEAASGLIEETRATGRPPMGQPGQGGNDDPQVAELRAKAYSTAFRSYLRQGLGENSRMSAEHRAVMQEEYERRAAQGTGEATGGATFVPEGFVAQVEEAMTTYGPMLNGGSRMPTILTTATGNPLPHPTDNDASVEGELLEENPSSATTQTGIAMGSIVFGAFLFSSKKVIASNQMLQDSAFPLEAYIQRKFGSRLGRVVNRYMTTGTGTDEPNGIVTASTLGVTAVGRGASPLPYTIGFDDLIDLEHSVDAAYRLLAAFMGHDSTYAHLKKLKDLDGRPVWLPGLDVKAPDTILGYPLFVNNHMDSLQSGTASPTVTKKTLLFGDLSKYTIRRVQEMTMVRNPFTLDDKFQVSFVASMRLDGDLLDAGTHPIKYLRNVA